MKKLIIYIFFVLLVCKAIGQINDNSNVLNVPMEQVFMHYNTNFLISGDQLYFRIYCLNKETKKLSDLSKIAYVELVNSDLKLIFKRKIRLEKGLGQGDYFLPSDIPSGNYKLLAYTQWMKNASVSSFFQDDVVIINPFQSNQKAVFETVNLTSEQTQQMNRTESSPVDINENIDIAISKPIFANRELVSFQLVSPQLLYGNYSLSVRKVEQIHLPAPLHASSILSGSGKDHLIIHSTNETYAIPELRGELIKGNVTFTKNGLPANDVDIALSIPDENFVFKISKSDQKGDFYFNLDKEYQSDLALIQIMDNEDNTYRFDIEDANAIDYSTLKFGRFSLDEELKEMILEHSIYNQIQNAFASSHIDQYADVENHTIFFNEPTYEYLLDDYTRFPTVRETILEVVEPAYTRRNKDKYSINVRVYKEQFEDGLETLLLVDGLFIEDHTAIVNSRASKIKKISIFNKPYIYGSKMFKGIVYMESFDRDYIETIPELKSRSFTLSRPQQHKDYFQIDYSNPQSRKRIPDNRLQLYWNPDVQIDTNTSAYHFYTSDLKGDFEIVLQGISKNGTPVTMTKTFTVR